MRSIGKRNIKKVEQLTRQELNKIPAWDTADYGLIRTRVIDQLPVDLWDTWEMADTEIHNIIDDILMKHSYRIG